MDYNIDLYNMNTYVNKVILIGDIVNVEDDIVILRTTYKNPENYLEERPINLVCLLNNTLSKSKMFKEFLKEDKRVYIEGTLINYSSDSKINIFVNKVLFV